jgi:membrane protein required for colicin V production
VIENIDYNNLNYLDITIISLIVILAIKGFVNGFLKEFFGAIGLVGGVILASQEYALAAQYIKQNIYPLENQALLHLAGFVAILLASWILASIVGVIVSYFANKNSKMGLVSRLLGLGLSAGKYFILFAVVIVSLLNIALIKENIEPRLDLNTSIVYPYIQEYGNKVVELEEMRVIHAKSFENSFKVKEDTSSTVQDNRTTPENNTTKKSNINSIIVKDK